MLHQYRLIVKLPVLWLLKRIKLLHCVFPVAVFLLFLPDQHAKAQADSSYFRMYEEKITGRFYLSRKYTRLMVKDIGRGLELDYRPNTPLNMGIGATYRSFTLNLAYGFPFMNPEDGKGKTRYLDLQAHMYGHRSTIDFFGQLYNGFYLSPQGRAASAGTYYVRPDVRMREFGASYQYVFNHRRFSYRAATLQNEWQRKSAGTFLLGAEFFIGRGSADSSVYPSVLAKADSPRATELRFIEFGPNFGYAYTLVIARHFFITGAISVSMDYNETDYSDGTNHTTDRGLSPNSILRFSAGYNAQKGALSVYFVNSRVTLRSEENNNVSISTGNIRLHYTRRFEPGPKTRKTLGRIFK